MNREIAARTALNLAIADLVAAHMGWTNQKGHTWMMTMNPNLGNMTPSELVMRGRSHKVLAFIETSIDENGSSESTKLEEK